MTPHDLIQKKLQSRQQAGSYRQLQSENSLIDFCSNDYLGFARSVELARLIDNELHQHSLTSNGSTGSRLLAGNTQYAENLERSIAHHHGAEAGLLYNSGYDANLGLLSCLPQRGDTVIHDELSHASIIDGIRLSYAKRLSFHHNDLADLEHKIMNAQGLCYVVVESVYSMDGDLANLVEIAALTQKYNAALIVDEAHAVGILGMGLVNKLGLNDLVFARVITFGKAMGCHGAIVLSSNLLRQYQINFSRSFIYTTAAPLHQLASIKTAYDLLTQSEKAIYDLQFNIKLYNRLMHNQTISKYTSAVQTLIIGDNERTKQAAIILQQAGFDVRAILSPTVAVGTERLRICLHAYNTTDEITQLVNTIQTQLYGQ